MVQGRTPRLTSAAALGIDRIRGRMTPGRLTGGAEPRPAAGWSPLPQ